MLQERLLALAVTKLLLKRLWEKRVLWFVRMHEREVAKIHPADLKMKYHYNVSPPDL